MLLRDKLVHLRCDVVALAYGFYVDNWLIELNYVFLVADCLVPMQLRTYCSCRIHCLVRQDCILYLAMN